jgi:CDP-glycerol glycerophosphotransferase (TagB/SpsB family)
MNENTNTIKDVISFWKTIYYEFHDLVKKERIFSKLPLKVMVKLYYNRHTPLHEKVTNPLKSFLIIPALMLWKTFPVKIEQMYYSWKYPKVDTLENLRNNDFEFLFILNTRDHIITALPVLESMNKVGEKILVVTFKGVYSKYREDFDRLNNAKIVFFEYELKNLPLRKYRHISKEVKDKMDILKSYSMDKTAKSVLLENLNYVKFHIRTELVQYHFFTNIFEYFDLKGVVSIVFTTAFEAAKERDVPTFILQHGIGGTDAWPYISDYFFAYDEKTKTNLEELLDDTVEILPVGAPRFEYLAKMGKNLKRRDFNNKIRKLVSTKNVTYISVGTEGFENKELFLVLKKLRQKLPTDVNLIIKLHPRGRYNTKKEIKKIFSKEELSGTIFIKKEMDFYEILTNSNVVITTLSTGMLESIAMDIPVLQLNFAGHLYPEAYDLSSFGWKEPIDDPDTMIKETLSILGDKKRYEEVIEKQRWLKNRMFTNFGNCGEIVAETIVDICNKNKR